MTEKITLNTTSRTEFIDITEDIVRIVKNKNIEDGIAFIYVPHTTAGITINESADSDVVRDIENSLKKIVPSSGGYLHSEGNSDAHIKTTLVKNSEIIFVEKSCLKLGTWQGIFFAEFDGPRRREVWIKTLKG